MVTYYVKLNEVYTITATAECKVYNASGVQITTCPANASINVKAATNMLKLSDDNAAIKKAVNEVAFDTSVVDEHINDTNAHVTAVEKQNLNTALSHVNSSDVHITPEEKVNLSNIVTSLASLTNEDDSYAPKNYGTPNAILITDANGNITASSVISVSELNTLNNNLSNIASKISSIESRLTALES